VPWVVSLHSDFEPEFAALPEDIRDELVARLLVLEEFGPGLGRPHVDTLSGSSFSNMKELRFRHDGLWRFAFAFDQNKALSCFVEGTSKANSRSGSTRRSSASRTNVLLNT
jgi:hypothetical protein